MRMDGPRVIDSAGARDGPTVRGRGSPFRAGRPRRSASLAIRLDESEARRLKGNVRTPLDEY